MNLCINAVDAMPEGGTLTLANRPATTEEVQRHAPELGGEYVCLTVSDTGTGMDEETLEHAFVPFYTKKPPGKGTGLGLYIVYGIIKAYEGWVRIESVPGDGTKVTLGMPATRRATAPSADAPAEPRLSGGGGGGKRVLVVDDEIGLLILLTEVLEEEAYEVTCAPDGEGALEIIEKSEDGFDLVITDLGMPNMGGRELIERLRVSHPELKILVASGYMDYEELAALKGLGVQAAITKPFQVSEVLEIVTSVMDG